MFFFCVTQRLNMFQTAQRSFEACPKTNFFKAPSPQECEPYGSASPEVSHQKRCKGVTFPLHNVKHFQNKLSLRKKTKERFLRKKPPSRGALKTFFLKTFANEFLLRRTFKGLKNKVKVDGRKEKPLLQEKNIKPPPKI